MSSNFPPQIIRSKECKSLTALSWSSYGSTSTLALMLFTTTMNLWKKASMDSPGRWVKLSYSLR
jgi:hypothetical protein